MTLDLVYIGLQTLVHKVGTTTTLSSSFSCFKSSKKVGIINKFEERIIKIYFENLPFKVIFNIFKIRKSAKKLRKTIIKSVVLKC